MFNIKQRVRRLMCKIRRLFCKVDVTWAELEELQRDMVLAFGYDSPQWKRVRDLKYALQDHCSR